MFERAAADEGGDHVATLLPRGNVTLVHEIFEVCDTGSLANINLSASFAPGHSIDPGNYIIAHLIHQPAALLVRDGIVRT